MTTTELKAVMKAKELYEAAYTNWHNNPPMTECACPGCKKVRQAGHILEPFLKTFELQERMRKLGYKQ